MATRTHRHAESFPCSRRQLFDLLITPSSIRQWWGASRAIVIPKEAGIWSAAWGEQEDQPDYITAATIKVFDPFNRMLLSEYRYFAKTGPLPFEAEFETDFRVSEVADGAQLEMIQSGFPAEPSADDYFAACQKGWQATFDGIRSFLSQF